LPSIEPAGWRDVTPEGNFAYDYKLDDGRGAIAVQVKLQRSEKGQPVVRSGARYGFAGDVFIVETQKTRTGTDGDANQTRPYRYGEFDVLAVSMQPSTAKWDRYLFTLGRWLLPGKKPGDVATLQPVGPAPNDFWTDSFTVAASWLRADDGGKRMALTSTSGSRGRRARRPPPSTGGGLPFGPD
jgi:hypothetical protein